MHPELRERVERLEALIGPAGVMQILSEGIDSIKTRLDIFQGYITSTDSPFVQRVFEILREADPEGGFKVEKGPDGLRMILQGRLTPDVEKRARAEFERLVESIPGLRQMLPEVGLNSRYEKVDGASTL